MIRRLLFTWQKSTRASHPVFTNDGNVILYQGRYQYVLGCTIIFFSPKYLVKKQMRIYTPNPWILQWFLYIMVVYYYNSSISDLSSKFSKTSYHDQNFCLVQHIPNTSLVVPRKKNRLRIKALSFEELSSLDILLLVKPPRDQFINCGLLKTELSTWGGMFIYCFFSV
jgi:hypothetical protein